MDKRTIGAAALCLAFVLGAGACGDDGGDEGGGEVDQELVDLLMEEGATQEEAECYIRNLGDDAEMIASGEEPDPEEQDRIVEAVQGCIGEEPEGDG